MIDRIDKDTDDIKHNVTEAKGRIFKLYTDITSSRKLMLQIFGFLMLFATLYVVVFM